MMQNESAQSAGIAQATKMVAAGEMSQADFAALLETVAKINKQKMLNEVTRIAQTESTNTSRISIRSYKMLEEIWVIVAHMKSGDKRFFNSDSTSGGYGYLSNAAQIQSNMRFFDFWNDRVGSEESSVRDIERLELVVIDVNALLEPKATMVS